MRKSRTYLSRLQNLERAKQTLVDTHHRTRVIELSTAEDERKSQFRLGVASFKKKRYGLVWRREKSDQMPPGEELVTILGEKKRGEAPEVRGKVEGREDASHDSKLTSTT